MIHYIRRLALRVLTMVGALFLCATILAAQDQPDVDVSKWNDVGTLAETAVDDPDTTDDALEELRSQIVSYRKEFDSARGVNATRIQSLREQLALLTPDETDGEVVPETQEVANNRLDLEKQLSALLTPVQVAETAFARADSLVDEIDAILRERQTDALFEVVETPLNPSNWRTAIESLESSWATLWITQTPEEAAARGKILRRNLPLIILTTLAGLVLIVRGRFWAKLIVSKLRQAEARGLRIWRFVVSLLRIIFPLIGLALLTHAARTTGYLGERGNEIAMLVPVLGGMMLGFRWVADQVFAREEDEALIELSEKDRAEARFCVNGVTFLLIVLLILVQILEFEDSSSLTKTVISFPFTVMISYAVFRLGRLLRHFGAPNEADDDGEVPRSSSLVRLVRSLGIATIGVSIAAPLLQAAGYYNASEFLLIPTVLTLVILGLVLALQRFSADVYGTMTGEGGQAREALIPTFFGFFLLVLALPVLALVWGARVSNLTEIWSAFGRGFSIGDSQISPTDFLTFALIFTVGYLATRLAQGALKTNVLPKTKIDKGAQNAIVSGLGYVGIFLAALSRLQVRASISVSLAIVAGALSVGIGFGLQNIVSNFVSGIILLIERPISEGDWIEVAAVKWDMCVTFLCVQPGLRRLTAPT